MNIDASALGYAVAELKELLGIAHDADNDTQVIELANLITAHRIVSEMNE